MDTTPYTIAVRDAATGNIVKTTVDPLTTFTWAQVTEKLYRTLTRHGVSQVAWVGLKRGERVLLRGRKRDGKWEWEEPEKMQDTLL